MSNPAAIFYYDEQATNLRSKLVQQGGKKLLFPSVKNFKPPKVAKKKPANNNNNNNNDNKKGSKKNNNNSKKIEQVVKTEAKVYPIKSGLVETFLTEKQLKFKQFYLTTAINYANGAPHIGHAYEGITSDIISRYHRMMGRDVLCHLIHQCEMEPEPGCPILLMLCPLQFW